MSPSKQHRPKPSRPTPSKLHLPKTRHSPDLSGAGTTEADMPASNNQARAGGEFISSDPEK